MEKKILEKYINDIGNLLVTYEKFVPYVDLQDKTVNAEFKNHIIDNVKKSINEQYPFLPASVYMQFKRNGNRTEYENIYFKRRNLLQSFFSAEMCEGQGRFTDLMIDGIWGILDESTWVLPAHNKSRSGKSDALTYAFREKTDYIDLFSAETAGLLSVIYYFAKDKLDRESDLISSRILYELERRIVYPFLNYNDMWWMGTDGNVLNNWTPWIISNVLTVCALCVFDDDIRKAIVEKSVCILDRFTVNYPDDGGCDEGPGYWNVAGASYFDCLELLYDLTAGGINLFNNPLVRAMGEYAAKVNISGNSYLNFADSTANISQDMYMIERFGRRVNSDMLRSFASNRISCLNLIPPVTGRDCAYRNYKNLCSPVPAHEDFVCDKKIWFDGLQIMAVREKQNVNEGLYLAVKGGHNAESHNHNDVGSFIVYSDGKPLIIDVGVGTYCADTFNGNRYKIWTMQSQYHNLPTINGQLQLPGRDRKATNVLYNCENELSMSLLNAYPAEALIESYNRKCNLKDSKITVCDSITFNESGNISFNLMFADEPVLNDDNTISISGRKIMYDTILNPVVEEIEITDRKISSAWRRNKLYRVVLTAENIKSKEFVMTIE